MKMKKLLCLVIALVLAFSCHIALPTAKAGDPSIHMHGGDGLIFVLNFLIGGTTPYQVIVNGNEKVPTNLPGNGVLEDVYVYDGDPSDGRLPLFIINGDEIKHVNDKTALLTDDGSMDKNHANVEKNHGDINFFFRGGLNSVTAIPNAKKITLNGNNNPFLPGSYRFRFNLYRENSSGGWDLIQSSTNNSSGDVSFTPLTFTAVGIYNFMVEEVIPSPPDPDWEYDLNPVRYVTVEVTQQSSNSRVLIAILYDTITGDPIDVTFRNKLISTLPVRESLHAVKRVIRILLNGTEDEPPIGNY